jgi:outer membrane immunogenic protein
MLRSCGIAIAGLFLLTCFAWAQDNTYEVSLGYAGVFNKQSTGNGTILTPTNSGAVLITGRYRFNDHNSVEINYSHTANSQIYFANPLTYRIKSTTAEYSGAYVYSFHESKQFEPFAFAGAGALVFYPSYNFNYINGVPSTLPASQQTKPMFLYGAGVDWRIFSGLPLVRRTFVAKYLALRLQYRGLVFKAPDYKIQNLLTGALGHMAEPSVGIVVKF